MELSRQMLLLTAVNYGSYYLHITYFRWGGFPPWERDLPTKISNV